MRVELLRAWPGRCETVTVELATQATVADALRAAHWQLEGEFVGLAVSTIAM